jgi:hypothetical protein
MKVTILFLYARMQLMLKLFGMSVSTQFRSDNWRCSYAGNAGVKLKDLCSAGSAMLSVVFCTVVFLSSLNVLSMDTRHVSCKYFYTVYQSPLTRPWQVSERISETLSQG